MKPNLRILIVDDMPAVRSILRNQLESLGLKNVDEAEDGAQAWEMICSYSANADQAYELVISDWTMPGLSGIDLVRALRAHPTLNRTHFLMVTAVGEQAKVVQALESGATGYIVKPFEANELTRKIQELPIL